MEDPSRKTVWGRFGSPMGTRTAAKGKMRFGRCAGEVAFPPSSHSIPTAWNYSAIRILSSCRTNTTQLGKIAMYHLIRTILRRKVLMLQWTISQFNHFLLILHWQQFSMTSMTEPVLENLFICNSVLCRPYFERMPILFPIIHFKFKYVCANSTQAGIQFNFSLT